MKTPHFRAAFSALHLLSTHFGAGYEARTRFPASHELPAAIRRNPASPLIGCALRARVEAASSLRLTKKQDPQIGCPVLTVQQRRKTAEVLRNGRKSVCGKPISGFLHHFNSKRNTTLLGGVSFCHVLAEKILDFSLPARKGMFAKEAIARFSLLFNSSAG